MNNLFQVGEIAIGQGFSVDVDHNGMECEILSTLHREPVIRWTDGTEHRESCDWYHRVRWANGEESVQSPWELRKKKPPANPVERVSEDARVTI